MKILISSLFILFFAQELFSQAWKTYPYAPDGSKITFPSDEGRHTDEPIEWWYSIGHFTGESTGTPYSYMLTYFHIKQLSYDGFRILNLCNEETGEFYCEILPLTYPSISTNSLNINALVGYFPILAKTETWETKTDGDNNVLPFTYNQKAQTTTLTANFGIDFNHNATKRPLIVADSGFLYIGDASYSYYYSQTRLALTGNITINNETEAISGTSWIDRQYGNFSPTNENDYEWFSLQLSNGMDINVYNVFTTDHRIPEHNAFRIMAVQVNDEEQYTISDFSIERLSYKYTADNERCYSQSWHLTSSKNNVDLNFSALYISNEVQLPVTQLDLPSRFYEGSVSVTGTIDGENVTGKGFAELIHHYEIPDVVMDKPVLQNNEQLQIAWKVQNKDEGNPLYYTLHYSKNFEEALFPIATEITDTFVIWELSDLQNNDYVQLFLNAKSVDGTVTTDVETDYTQIISSSGDAFDNAKLNVYPNPAKKYFQLGGENIVKIELYNVNGQLVMTDNSKNITQKTFNIEHLKKGTYILKSSNSKNGISSVKLIVK